MNGPWLLDLFCCSGGCTEGYQRAGFQVVGVDINPQPNYCGDRFLRGDALGVLDELISGLPVADIGPECFAAIHASPPCQAFTKYKNVRPDLPEKYPDLIEPTRARLRASGKPWVMENVEGAPLIDPLVLCGSMFDLDVRRHRLFEAEPKIAPPVWGCRHKIWSPRFKSSTGRRPNSRLTVEIGSWDEPLDLQKRAMGVEREITLKELSQSIPPAYTEHIGRELMRHIARAERADLDDWILGDSLPSNNPTY